MREFLGNQYDSTLGAKCGLRSRFWTTADIDASGITDSWEVALLEEVVCRGGRDLGEGPACDFLANLATLRTERTYSSFADFEKVVAALLSVSGEMQTTLTTFGLIEAYVAAGAAGNAAGDSFELFQSVSD